MKTLAKTIFAAALTAVLFTSSMVATFAAEPVKTETKTSSLSKFNRIWVSGNVKIVLTQGDRQNVEGAGNYDGNPCLPGDLTLRVTTFKKQEHLSYFLHTE